MITHIATGASIRVATMHEHTLVYSRASGDARTIRWVFYSLSKDVISVLLKFCVLISDVNFDIIWIRSLFCYVF